MQERETTREMKTAVRKESARKKTGERKKKKKKEKQHRHATKVDIVYHT